MEPHLTLAFAMRSNPGGYALLLGAGVSMAAGVPSAWGVQDELIGRLAEVQRQHPSDRFIWYQERYGKPSSYDDLLDALTQTPHERQSLLREFFEPTAEERENGQKLPTPAHEAIARLAASGLVRVILTINFDRLTEAALRSQGVEPTVVASTADIDGLAPLHTIRCLVLHLHGDYLNPTSMLNTAAELQAYPDALDKLLDRVFDEYGLVIAGWSASWDTALRQALARCPTRRFSTYWVDSHPLGELAQNLLTQRQATFVESDADTFFGELADACDALRDTARRHPATVDVAVASAKRALAGAHTAIPLHDTLRRELHTLRTLDGVSPTTYNSADAKQEHAHRLSRIEAGSEVALALIATTSYWGNEDTDQWWASEIEDFAQHPGASGDAMLVNLVRSPATMVIYAGGVAAAAAGRWAAIGRLLTEHKTVDPYTGDLRSVGQLLGPGASMSLVRASRRLHHYLAPIFERLAVSGPAFVDAWERFEYLRLVATVDWSLQAGKSHGSDIPHIRADGRSDDYAPIPATWLRRQIELYGNEHPLLLSGLAGGDASRLIGAADTYDNSFSCWASETAWSSLPAGGGALPSGPWLPDERGQWVTAD